ncbi:MAG: DUF1294 domain-containing protein [Rickettsiales bacterium]
MLLFSAVILIVLAGLIRGLRNSLYGLHVALVMGSVWLYFPDALDFTAITTAKIVPVLAMHLISINLLTFALYGWDKSSARKGRWRVPERVLHAFGLAGGLFGALFGQKIFRHKTRKGSFRVAFWLTAWVQIVLLYILFVATH